MIIELLIPITLVVFVLFIVYRYEDPGELKRDLDLAKRLQDFSRERQRQEDQTRKELFDHEEVNDA